MKKEDLQMLLFPPVHFSASGKRCFYKVPFLISCYIPRGFGFHNVFSLFLRLFQNRKPAIVSHKVSRPRKPVTSYTVQKELK